MLLLQFFQTYQCVVKVKCCYISGRAPSLVGCLRLLVSYFPRYPLLEVGGWKDKHGATPGMKDFLGAYNCLLTICALRVCSCFSSSFGATTLSRPGPGFTSTAFSLFDAKVYVGARIVQTYAFQSILAL